MTRLVITNNPLEINRVLLQMHQEIDRLKQPQTTVIEKTAGSQPGAMTVIQGKGGSGPIQTVPHMIVIPATNPDCSIRTDADGCALMQVVTIKEPV